MLWNWNCIVGAETKAKTRIKPILMPLWPVYRMCEIFESSSWVTGSNAASNIWQNICKYPTSAAFFIVHLSLVLFNTLRVVLNWIESFFYYSPSVFMWFGHLARMSSLMWRMIILWPFSLNQWCVTWINWPVILLVLHFHFPFSIFHFPFAVCIYYYLWSVVHVNWLLYPMQFSSYLSSN